MRSFRSIFLRLGGTQSGKQLISIYVDTIIAMPNKKVLELTKGAN